MAKRTATRELNHDNWEDDDEPEEAGNFQTATPEALQGRVIKQARRRLAGDGEAKKNVFAGFAGFGARPTPTTTAFNISFTPTATPAKANGESKPQNTDVSSEKDYLAGLKALNETVSQWISDHVKKNSYCVLTPIFTDYEKHLKDLESKRTLASIGENAKTITKPETEEKKFQFTPVDSKPNLNFFGATSTPTSSFTFKGTSSESAKSFSFKSGVSSDTLTTSTSTFSFKPANSNDTKTSNSSSSTAPIFSFTSSTASTTTTTTPAFSFGMLASNKPLTAVEEKKKEEAEEEEDEDAPPKVEIKPIQEEDAFYSIRCKLFYKKENSYVEKGVGTMHLKKVKDDKTQLVIRADTSLGNILLNILLNPQLTTQRVGKNNVMLVCVPNPPIDPKTAPVPTPMLLRVKTDAEADELLAKLNDSKK